MDNLEFTKLQRDVASIIERNKKVEEEKAWEISFTRKAVIASITYCTMALILISLKSPTPFFGAVIPTVGYVLSTLSLPVVKRVWIKRREY